MRPYLAIAASVAALVSVQAQAQQTHIGFDMTVSTGASKCLPNAYAKVTIRSFNLFENLEVLAKNLPANTDFDLFVIQVPNAPFGGAFYLGDVFTDSTGTGITDVVGRFNIGTFIISNGVAATNTYANPDPPGVVPEATTGFKTNPVQLYHLGLWFDSAADAATAGCPNTVTPFNSTHDGGIQVLNTATYPDTAGPLFKLKN
jgi:hypothetical protein